MITVAILTFGERSRAIKKHEAPKETEWLNAPKTKDRGNLDAALRTKNYGGDFKAKGFFFTLDPF